MDLVEKLPPEISEKISELKLGKDIEILYNNLRKHIREAADPAAVRKNYHGSHEFLSQQIDERSHQVWILGSLFVPVSFLIFTYAVVNTVASPFSEQLLLGSLACYLIFYLMYRRITLLNDSCYPYIHALELVLGLEAHLRLREFWIKRPFLQWRVHFFTAGLFALTAIWAWYLAGPTRPPLSPILIAAIAILYVTISLRTRKVVPSLEKPQKRERNAGLVGAGVATLFAALVLGVISVPPLIDGIIPICLDPAFDYRLLAVVLNGALGAIFLLAGAIGRKKQPGAENAPRRLQAGAAGEGTPSAQSGLGSQQSSTSEATPQTVAADHGNKEKEETVSREDQRQ